MNYDSVENKEMLVKEYMNHLHHMEVLKKTIDSMKSSLSKLVEEEGEVDEKGHQWLKVGDHLLQRQRRQGASTLDAGAAEEWARENGVWNKVSKVIEVLDEDALMAYVYEHRDEDGLEDMIKSLYKEAPTTYAFIKPSKEEVAYDY
jgi:hypothetical protein